MSSKSYFGSGFEQSLLAALLPKKGMTPGQGQEKKLLDAMGEGVLLVNKTGIITYANQGAKEVFRLPVRQLIGRRLEDFLSRPDGSSWKGALKERQQKRSYQKMYLVTGPRGRKRAVAVTIARFAGNASALSVVITDMSSRAESSPEELRARREENFHLIAEAIPQIVWTARPDGKIDFYNHRWTEYTGLTPEQSFNEGWITVLHPEDVRPYERRWHKAVTSGEAFEVECRYRNGADGGYQWHLCRALPVRDAQHKIIKWFGTSTNIDKQKRTEEQVRYQATHDSLTGLPNRTLLEDRLNQVIINASRNKQKFGVMLLDLDNFKTINDNLGHPIGDELLQEVARRLRRAVRAEDTVARLGGDEFTIIAQDVASKLDVVRVSRKITEALSGPFMVSGHELHVTTSMGIALYPQHGRDALTLLKNADIALYKAKDMGRNSVHFYNRALDLRAKQRFTLEQKIRYALKHDGFTMHYQPVLELRSNKIVAVEALLRWKNSERETISTEELIECAEDVGVIHHVTDFVLKAVCAEMQQLKEAGFPQVKVAINLSPKQFMQPTLVDTIISFLESCNIASNTLRLEITENLAMSNIEMTMEKLKTLRHRGVEVYLDDFGIGHSSLNHLKHFPIQSLKIDRSFIHDCTRTKEDAAIVRAIISMAKNLDLMVIAEGVENDEQLQFLKRLGCDGVQGFGISRALDGDQLIRYLQRRNRALRQLTPAIAK